MTNREKVDYINDLLSSNELLLALAEEAAELSQAALKLRRALIGLNPTQVTQEEATQQLNEEMGDTMLCWRVLVQQGKEGNVVDWEGDLIEVQQQKLDRWVRRLMEAWSRGLPTDKDTLDYADNPTV